jgi:hypothetical protein
MIAYSLVERGMFRSCNINPPSFPDQEQAVFSEGVPVARRCSVITPLRTLANSTRAPMCINWYAEKFNVHHHTQPGNQ